MDVIKLAKKGINIPFYNIIEMKEILLKEKGNQGEIFINDLNKVFFREKV